MNAQFPAFVAIPGNGAISMADRSAGAVERQLLAAVERTARHPRGWVALVLHLSALYPPAPRPHHLRIARVLMHDVAQRQDGQSFTLRNGDVVLLCRDESLMSPVRAVSGAVPAASPLAALPATLGRLFRREAADAAGLVSVWPLAHEAERLLGYAASRLASSDAAPADDAAAPVAEVVNTVDALLAYARPADLIQRQAGVLLVPGTAQQIRPIYQELSFSLDLLEARIDAPGQIGRDPFLLQHLANRLDARMLRTLHEDHGRGGPLDPGSARLPLYLRLTISGLLSDGFAALAAVCRDVGRPLGAEVLLVEAAADPTGFSHARKRAGQLGAKLVLDGMSHLALLVACPWLLRPDLLKLDWSPRLPDLPEAERAALGDAIRQVGPARLILHRADSEAAIRWGVAHGIRRFQGRHIDVMLAAARIVACPVASRCSLRQCTERASAAGGGGRASCGNHALLDAGAPESGNAERPA